MKFHKESPKKSLLSFDGDMVDGMENDNELLVACYWALDRRKGKLKIKCK